MDRRRFLCCMGFGGIAAMAGCATDGSAARSDKQDRCLKPEDVAYCGVDCTSCDVYKITVHGETERLDRAIKGWTKTAQEHWGMKTLDPAMLRCRGCRYEGKDRFMAPKRCPIRRCVTKRNLPSCGLCPDWQKCTRLGNLLAECPEARANIERIAAGVRKADEGR